MQWLNIHLSVLNSEEFLDSEPTARATWLCLLAYCATMENGGRVVGVKAWKDRKCQQIIRTTRAELDDPSMLWAWEGDDLIVNFYPIDQEELIRAKRGAGKIGGSKSTEAKKRAARAREQARQKAQADHKQTTSKAPEKPKPAPKKEEADPGEEFYRTAKKRKLTGKRLEAFNRFWEAFAYPKGKAAAADSWLDIPELTNALVEQIIAAAKSAAKERAKMKALRPDFTPQYAQGWISQKRWEDGPAHTDGEHSVEAAKPKIPDNWKVLRDRYFADPENEMVDKMVEKKARETGDWFEIPRTTRRKIIEYAKR